MPTKKELLTSPIQHIDIKQHNVVPLVDAMQSMAYSSRDLARAASIYERMLRDQDCGVILCLAGSLISAGLKQIFVDLIRNNMVDAIVSTGANIVDQDFFEALGYKHWIADDLYRQGTEDATLRELMIDRIYDTLIDEEELRLCDDTCKVIADSLDPRPYSSREFIREMGAYLEKQGKTPEKGGVDSIIYSAYQMDVPIFVPAFSDCSAGFGLVAHQHGRGDKPKVSIDSVKDFYELTQLKIANPTTGLLMIGGGVPEELRPGHRGRGRDPRPGCPDAQVRDPDHGRRCARRSALLQHAQGSEFLGQGRHDLRANGVQRGDPGVADDHGLCLS